MVLCFVGGGGGGGEGKERERENLNEDAAGVGDVAVEFAIAGSVHLRGDPAELAVQFIRLHQLMHLLYLRYLFSIIRTFHVVVSRDHSEIRQLPQLRTPTKPLHQSRYVLHLI